MKKLFAIPTIDNKLCAHFGRCEKFAIITTNGKNVIDINYHTPPVHEPGTYPRFLADKGVEVIISGGMGNKAKVLFDHNNIEVFMGIDSEIPEVLVEKYLKDQLESKDNLCDH